MVNKYLKELKEIVLDSLKTEDVKIFIFGSRARNDNSPASDVDIGLIPKNSLDPIKLSMLKEKIGDSNIPYKVEIVNFNDVSEEFKKEAMKNTEIWKD